MLANAAAATAAANSLITRSMRLLQEQCSELAESPLGEQELDFPHDFKLSARALLCDSPRSPTLLRHLQPRPWRKASFPAQLSLPLPRWQGLHLRLPFQCSWKPPQPACPVRSAL